MALILLSFLLEAGPTVLILLSLFIHFCSGRGTTILRCISGGTDTTYHSFILRYIHYHYHDTYLPFHSTFYHSGPVSSMGNSVGLRGPGIAFTFCHHSTDACLISWGNILITILFCYHFSFCSGGHCHLMPFYHSDFDSTVLGPPFPLPILGTPPGFTAFLFTSYHSGILHSDGMHHSDGYHHTMGVGFLHSGAFWSCSLPSTTTILTIPAIAFTTTCLESTCIPFYHSPPGYISTVGTYRAVHLPPPR